MKTYISKNLPNGTTIYEKILLAKFESLYFKKDDDILKKFTDKLSKNEFWIPLKEFNLEYKAQKVQSNINSLLFKLRNDVSIEAFYQIMSDLAFSPDQTLQTLCQVILYWQMQMAPQSFSFEIESYMRQIIDNIMELKNDLIMVFAHFLESSITFINMQDKNNYKIRNFDVDKPVDTLCLTVSRNADIHILHYTRAVLPESIYEQANFNHPLTEDDLVLKKGANSYDRNEERKYDQGEVKNYEQPAKKDPHKQFLSILTQFAENYANGLDLRTNSNFAVISKNWKSDLKMAIKLLPEDGETKTNLENSLFSLAAGIEDIKTHLAFQPSSRDACDICRKKDGYFYSIECNWAKEFVPAFCRICFGMLLRSKFYMEINKAYLTLECFEKETCMKRMIFTEDSLGKIFQNENILGKFLQTYKKLRDKNGTCFSCHAKFSSELTGNDDMCLTCPCKKQTCKSCWEEVHFEKLCKHLQEEYNTVAVHDLIDKIIVCHICFAVTRIPNADEVSAIEGTNHNRTSETNESKVVGSNNRTSETKESIIESIKCDGCHRQLCKKCFQSIDAILRHGPCIHEFGCSHYSIKRNKDYKGECEICEIKGYPCNEMIYRKFLGF